MDQSVLFHENRGIAFITLNRPDALNAMDLGVLERLSLLLNEASTSQAVKAAINTRLSRIVFMKSYVCPSFDR